MSEMLEKYFAFCKIKNTVENFVKVIDLCAEKGLCVDCPYRTVQPEECIRLLLTDSRDLIIKLHENQKAIRQMIPSVPRGLGKSHASLGILE